MVSMKQFVVLALSGTSMAVPAVFKRDWNYGQGYWHADWSRVSSSDIAVVTETATAAATYMATATATITYSNVPVVTSTAAAKTSTTSIPVSTTSSAPAASSTCPSDSTDPYCISKRERLAAGLKIFAWDTTLVANALKTVTDSNGQMVHELNSGSMAQVLGPGNTGNFESVYVGGWLCEIPTLPGLNGRCATAAQGWDHSDGETGHAEILSSTSYTKIGCALYAGIWACDLA